jgi:hypothetical protein
MLFALLSFQSVVEGKKKELDETTTNTEETTDEAAIELNPDYDVEPVENDEDAVEAASDDDDKIEDQSSVKGQIAAALHKTKKTSRTAMKLAKKHRSSGITFCSTVFAFRQEILKGVVHLANNQLVDPKTGKVRINPTKTLKVLLFVNFMRRLQQSGGGGLGIVNNNTALMVLLVLEQSNPIMGALLSKVLNGQVLPMFNPASIPPIAQHYTFERVNERYVKDGMALHKAIHAKQL